MVHQICADCPEKNLSLGIMQKMDWMMSVRSIQVVVGLPPPGCKLQIDFFIQTVNTLSLLQSWHLRRICFPRQTLGSPEKYWNQIAIQTQYFILSVSCLFEM